MTKPIQTIGSYQFHGWDENGDCLSCGFDTEQGQSCLCDQILYYLKMASSWEVSDHFQDLYLENAVSLLEERDFYNENRRYETPPSELDCSPF